ncbi:MAG: hypothetical protein IKC91_00940 [Clostridia bacterium]|nr:hypothetical protein [Clostridia bacterium]
MINIVRKDFEIHVTPLEKIELSGSSIVVWLDDIHENRIKLNFKVFQALKVTTIDCVSMEKFYNKNCFVNGVFHRHILEMENSPWIEELRNNLVDDSADFLNKSRHFILPLQDNIIEIVAWNIELQKL